jgi:hypothetical protein
MRFDAVLVAPARIPRHIPRLLMSAADAIA